MKEKTIIFKEFMFEAAHRLPHVPVGHKCGRLHGHSFKFRLEFLGYPDIYTGFILDFADIKEKIQHIYNILDHSYLNDIDGLENPTSENIAKWLYLKIKQIIPELNSVEIWETCTCGAKYYE